MTEIEFTDQITVELVDHMGSDEMVVAAAMVSTKGPDAVLNEIEPNKVMGLINFLMANRHATPFEHGAMTFFVEAPIFVFREWHRHRIGWSYNEESGRYKKLRPKFYIPNDTRNLRQIGKPGAYEFVPGTDEQKTLLNAELRDSSYSSYEKYSMLLDEGVAKEVARMALPVNIYSSMYATCNPRSLMSFLSLRTKSDEAAFKSFPMHEIEVAALKMEERFADLWPITYDAYVRHGRVSP